MNFAGPRRARNIALSIWLPVAVLGAWQALAAMRLLNPLFFPAPSFLLASGWQMLGSGELGSQVGATMMRMLAGCALGVLSGLGCGLLMGAVAPARRTLEPMISALNSTPKLALLPMLMLIAGIGETARIVPIALTGFVILSMHGLDAVRGVDRSYVEMARNHGAGRRALLRRVYLPASLPQVFTGLRLALGRTLVITISVELVGAQNGLGNMIWMAWQTFATEKLYIGVFAAAALGALFHNGLLALEKRLIPWQNRAGAA
ncbi:MAG TPA: ABC transporter permease [Bryobacteraceae bacterium]|nr:ABC transporter permease [Bryobacteraceae bacterium]